MARLLISPWSNWRYRHRGPIHHDEVGDDEDSYQLAEVIPLGVFDAHEEAKRWW